MHCRNDDTVGEPSPDKGRSSRRHFLSQLAALSASLTIAAPAARAASSKERSKPEIPDSERGESLVDIVLKVNGQEKPLKVDSRVTVLDAVSTSVSLIVPASCARGRIQVLNCCAGSSCSSRRKQASQRFCIL